MLISPLASAHPDGLERVAEDLGFISAGTDNAFYLFSDYALPFISNEGVSTIMAGLVGILVLLIIAFGYKFLQEKKAG